MRCLLRNAGAMLAMIWSGAGAVAALAGPVNLRTSSEFSPAAIVKRDEQLAIDFALPTLWWRQHIEALDSWFPDTLALQPGVPVPPQSAAPPPAIMIPLPAPIYLALAGLGCTYLVARVFRPWPRRE